MDWSLKITKLKFRIYWSIIGIKVSHLNSSIRLEISKSQGLNFEFNEIVETFTSKTWNFKIGFQMLNEKNTTRKTVIYGPFF